MIIYYNDILQLSVATLTGRIIETFHTNLLL